MSDFPITPQQDYLTIQNTTGKGFRQSVLLSELNIRGLLPITAPGGAAVTGTPVSSNGLVFDGTNVYVTLPGLVELTVTANIDQPVGATKHLLRILVSNLGYEYSYNYECLNQTTITFKVLRRLTPGDFMQIYLSKGDSNVTVITPIDYNARLY